LHLHSPPSKSTIKVRLPIHHLSPKGRISTLKTKPIEETLANSGEEHLVDRA